MYYRRDKFASAGTKRDSPYSVETTVYGGKPGTGQVANSAWGQNTLWKNAPDVYSVGRLGEEYAYGKTETERDECRRSSRFRSCLIRASPRWGSPPLGSETALRRDCRTKPGTRSTKCNGTSRTDNWAIVRLHFSPQHGDSLAKSEYELARADAGGKLRRGGWRAIRTVEKWQALSDGTFVPARFTVQQSREKGTAETVLVREIANPVIGDLDHALFDTVRLPAQFDVKWTSVSDGRSADGGYEPARAGPPKVRRRQAQHQAGRPVGQKRSGLLRLS